MNCIPVDNNGYPVRGLTSDIDYTPPSGVRLIYNDLPYALSLCKKRWTGSEWVETATPEEIEKWQYPDGRPEPITPVKSNTELEAELEQTNSLLGDTILSGWETQAELDLNEQILGDTILSTWEMDERITEIEEKIGGQEQ